MESFHNKKHVPKINSNNIFLVFDPQVGFDSNVGEHRVLRVILSWSPDWVAPAYPESPSYYL